ncbi:hypothetical protein [Prevotella sp. tf2-5]|uniref:hypothetical protein n=1 Tax=Prevotella sp. tf2-5 TaxID=1761889 RepID=UPI0008F00C82|nr:hypothetical protein [Prevotella sp. tf2-5]SFP03499.1 hypothetical protein SAMN04487852_11390 [Prevotella sp. tf2-5]
MEIPVEAIADSIQRGDILLSEFDGIDHRKFFVVMGISEDKVCGFFFINSNIHPAIFNKQEQLNMQYLLLQRDYEFLKYDSFLCASSVIERRLVDISEGIRNKTTQVIGHMKEEHITDVIKMVRESKVISERHKRLYFY